MSGLVVLPYQPLWVRQFADAATALAAVFQGFPFELEHIGSTAVPGLCAKPVLDVMAGVVRLRDVEVRLPDLQALGYRYRPEHEASLPDRRYFVRDAGATEGKNDDKNDRPDAMPHIHLHAVVLGSPLWQGHLAFRDALRRDAGLAHRYGRLKQQLALAHARNKAAYTEAKAPFIRAVLATVAAQAR